MVDLQPGTAGGLGLPAIFNTSEACSMREIGEMSGSMEVQDQVDSQSAHTKSRPMSPDTLQVARRTTMRPQRSQSAAGPRTVGQMLRRTTAAFQLLIESARKKPF